MNERGRRAAEWYARYASLIDTLEWVLLFGVLAFLVLVVLHC